ncbi:MAG: nitronate monooxygenase [Hyphomicrobiales bacterium]
MNVLSTEVTRRLGIRNPEPYMSLIKKLNLTIIHKVPAVRFALKEQSVCIGHGSQITAALAMGASGVVLGTRLLVSDELTAHKGYKEAIVKASGRDTALVLHTLCNTVRSLANETTQAVAKMEADNPNVTIDELVPFVSGKIGRKAYETGDVSKGLLSAGHALGLTKAIAPMAEIFAQMETEAQVALGRLNVMQVG